jgi:hypothetical protein
MISDHLNGALTVVPNATMVRIAAATRFVL